tara:strand:- start:4238 stop:4657 length:420 start_codon:yes stop_codon:yes gene_type:complete
MSSLRNTLIKQGEILFNEGSFSDCAYIIESGALEVLKKDDLNEEVIVAILYKNDIVGEMGLIDGMPRSATVRARFDTRLNAITRKEFHLLSEKNPNALMPVMKVLANRLRDSLDKVVNSPEIGHIRRGTKMTHKASMTF